MKYFLRTIILTVTLLFTLVAKTAEVKIDVTLTPAGDFVAETKKITGFAYKTPTGVIAENIEVDIASLTTGIQLRDKHLKEKLLSTKHPKAKLIKAIGKNGKGKASIEIKGIKKTYDGTYEIEDSELRASFKIHLPDLDIKDVSYMGVGVDEDILVNVTLPLKEKSK